MSMKKLIVYVFIISVVPLIAYAGGNQDRKIIEIQPRSEWSSYQRLKAQYNNALLEIEDQKLQIEDLESYTKSIEDYINNRKPEVVTKEVVIEKPIKETVEVIPWWIWIALVGAIFI
jgi:hypothetical protein